MMPLEGVRTAFGSSLDLPRPTTLVWKAGAEINDDESERASIASLRPTTVTPTITDIRQLDMVLNSTFGGVAHRSISVVQTGTHHPLESLHRRLLRGHSPDPFCHTASESAHSLERLRSSPGGYNGVVNTPDTDGLPTVDIQGPKLSVGGVNGGLSSSMWCCSMPNGKPGSSTTDLNVLPSCSVGVCSVRFVAHLFVLCRPMLQSSYAFPLSLYHIVSGFSTKTT